MTVETRAEKTTRAYRILAWFVGLGLLAAFVIGAMGATGPGVLSPESAFLVAGLAILVVAIALVYVLSTYRTAFARVQSRNLALENAMRNDKAQIERLEQDLHAFRRNEALREAKYQARFDEIATLAPRMQQTEDIANRLVAETSKIGDEVERIDANTTLLDEHNRSQDERIASLDERLDTTAHSIARVENDEDQRATELERANAERVLETRRLAGDVEDLMARSAKLESQTETTETRVSKLESIEDDRDLRLDQHDQRLAVLELRMDESPRHSRTIETRLNEITTVLAETQHQVGEERQKTQDLLHRFDVITAELSANAAERARLERDVQRLADRAPGEASAPDLLPRLEELAQKAQETQVQLVDLTSIVAAHVKHPAVVSIADIKGAFTPTPSDDLEALEGIGPVFARRLARHNIQSYQELRAADADAIAPKIGAHPKTFRSWQAMAGLMQVPGVDHQVAELLVRIGIADRDTLSITDPQEIVDRVNAYNERHEIPLNPHNVSRGLAAEWVDAAREQVLVAVKP